jgi:carboxyl-terminal processing protease
VNRTLQWLRGPGIAVWTTSLALILGAAAGGSAQPLSSATASRTESGTSAATASLSAPASGRLIAQILADIGTYYLEPVSVRRVAVAGAARLGGIDSRLAIQEERGTVALTYDNRTLASYRAPAESDTAGWGATVETIMAAARQASPQLAALPAETVEQAVLDGMTRSLDRFSRYAPPDMARDQRAARNGWGGIGIIVDGAQDIFRVTAVEPQSPADRAGIRPEDQIVAIDGVTTHGCVHREVVERLRGAIGTPVSIRFVPAGAAQERELQLQRASVFEPTVSASRDGDIGVIQVHSFNHRTTARVVESLADLQTRGRLSGIVLDLRSNPGGVLDEAASLTDLFLRRGPIVSVVGRHPASRQ